MRHVVLGANGLLAHALCARLPGEVIRLGRDRANLTRPESCQAELESIQPDVVVNCAAYNFVDRAEQQAEECFAVNALGVRALARWCRDADRVLVHWSTNYVFGLDETRRSPYGEDDLPGPLSVYGASKLAGEYFVRAICPKHFVIRTCGLYGIGGGGGKGTHFVETMLRIAGQDKPLRVVADQICTPSYTVDVAEAAVKLIAGGAFGLYQLTNAGACSWHEFASTIFKLRGGATTVAPITSPESGAAASRPAYSVLSMQKLTALGIKTPRPWQEALADYLKARR